jgi:GNAT superfamily N-acetyltransferase
MNDPVESISVRRATAADAGAMARLSGELGYPVETDAMRARIRAVTASAADLLVVAEDPTGEPAGWLQAHSAHLIESGFRVEIVGLIVSPAARRTGLGRSLVAAAERWATSIQAEALVVRSNVQRDESHAFYPALGFSATKTQHVYRKSLPNASSGAPNGSGPLGATP